MRTLSIVVALLLGLVVELSGCGGGGDAETRSNSGGLEVGQAVAPETMCEGPAMVDGAIGKAVERHRFTRAQVGEASRPVDCPVMTGPRVAVCDPGFDVGLPTA